ncbi:MAG: excinuclease ABC subunit UvrA [Ignavibacteria bacterium]|jgi:excinuclease ABC subunit A|nr:excinuclease ABC subunit UvrA [Ignavibacteria bacterium]
MSNQYISIKNASHNNLKNISLDIPRNKITLITGVSGSGKSTLAFDTLYAEGQRRFVESLSSYARQFLERMTKPEVDSITGLPPAVAIEQKTPPRNSRSTIGTVTEIYDYIRAMYSRIGKTYCVKCGNEITVDNPTSISNTVLNWKSGNKVYIMFELRSTVSNIANELQKLSQVGYTRVVPNGSNDVIDINDLKVSVKTNIDDYLVLVDRWIVSKEKNEVTRLVDSIEVAFAANPSKIIIRNITTGVEEKFSSVYECAECGIKYEEPDAKLFAFNNPRGACPVCQGLGQVFGVDENLVVPDKTLSLDEHCIHPYRSPSTASVYRTMIDTCKELGIPTNVPYSELSQFDKDVIWEGNGKYFGITKYFQHLESKNYKIQNRLTISRYRGMATCMKCNGSRIKMEARQVFVHNKNIPDIVNMPMDELHQFFSTLKLTDYEMRATDMILHELISRVKMLLDIGLEYLTLSRSCQTLSGGEYQRINLSTALGSTLVGTLYVLDEPSIGMHPRDTYRLLDVLHKLRDLGNTIVVVEHDPEIISNADYIIDMGVGAGAAGGRVLAAGGMKDLLKSKESLTAQYFNKEKFIPIPKIRRNIDKKNVLTLTGAAENNLRIPKVNFPLKAFVVVTGVSGSGKSSLVYNILYNAALEQFGRTAKDTHIGAFDELFGCNLLEGIELVDQSPIGKSTRSTPVTYMKIFDYIRELYSHTQAAIQLGLKAQYFSFNMPGGRCDVCEGDGYVNIDMQFLPDIRVECEACGGTRYKREVADILYHEKSIIDVLNMSVDEAYTHFKGIDKIQQKLGIMREVGLGYLKLGQPSSTLSGGEAQRIKLSSHIESLDNSNYLYVFDEPTTGLHLDDIAKLLKALNKLVDTGNSVLIIEHNLNVMSVADWIIDLGPEAGKRGGTIVGEGTPEDIAKLNTHTGIAIKKFLKENVIE